tara:strand:+ start:10173 stop:10562 length:390 start_codon:yes stop_codon:yes gene_type:complete
MSNRTYDLLKIRPDIKKIESFDKMSKNEHFQNETLRPILKMQNPILLEVFRNYIDTRKGVFYKLSNETRLEYIEKTLQKDQKIQNYIKGIIIGHFTIKEFNLYSQNISALNKRIMSLVIKRIKDQVSLF